MVITPSQYLEGAGQLGTLGEKAQGARRAGGNSPGQKLTSSGPAIGSPRGAHCTQAGAGPGRLSALPETTLSRLGPQAAVDGQRPPRASGPVLENLAGDTEGQAP